MSPWERIDAARFSPPSAGFDVAGRLDLARECIARDAYDEAAFQDLLDESHQLRECVRRGQARLRSFPTLLSDVFCLFFKLRPAMVDRTCVRPAFQVNRHLIARLAIDPRVKMLRENTPLDEGAAGAATLSTATRLLDELRASRLADENVLFELEEAVSDSDATVRAPAGVYPRPAAEHGRGGSGEGSGCGGDQLPYDLQQRLEMAEALRGFRSFERLLSLTRELASRLTTNDPTRWHAAEVYDIGIGNELSRLLPSELLSLLAPFLKKDFLRKFLGRQLLTYQIRGREFTGPMVILVDVSQSMVGEKELASKALAIALSQVAATRRQPASAILFGPRTSPLWQVDFGTDRMHKHELAALAGTFFGGGTDFERPISAALDLISRRGEAGGHVVFISDGLCEVSETWLSRILAKKARRRIQILSVLLDIEPCSDSTPASFSDRIIRWSELMGSGGQRSIRGGSLSEGVRTEIRSSARGRSPTWRRPRAGASRWLPQTNP